MLITGWIITRNQNNVREDRHELRGTLDSVTKEISELEDKAYDFYMVDAGPATIKPQVDILADYEALKAKLQRLRKFDERFRDQDRLFNFRDALIGGSFEETDRKSCEADDQKLSQLTFAARQLVAQLEAVYNQIYKPSRGPSVSLFVLITAIVLALAAAVTLGVFQYFYFIHFPGATALSSK